MVLLSHLVHFISIFFSKVPNDVLAVLGIRLSRCVQWIEVPHVEDTCSQASCLLLGEGLLGDAHLVLDGVYGVGEDPTSFCLHVVEPSVEEVPHVDSDVEISNLAVLGECFPSLGNCVGVQVQLYTQVQ